MKERNSETRSPQGNPELEALEAVPDQYVDTSDIPEILDWSGAKRGGLYSGGRPRRRTVTP